MPVSAVAVTEGSGKSLHTWQRSISSVNREDQYVQLGEPALPTFVACNASALSTATTDSHLMQIMSGASTYTRIHRISISQVAAAGASAALGVYLYRLTTAGSTSGGGTEITPRPYDTADTAGATAITLPGTKGTEGVMLYAASFYLSASAGAGTYGQRVFWESGPRMKPIILPSGTSNGLAIKIGSGVATSTVIVAVEFTETAWL